MDDKYIRVLKWIVQQLMGKIFRANSNHKSLNSFILIQQ
jgi:hypothetical protein